MMNQTIKKCLHQIDPEKIAHQVNPKKWYLGFHKTVSPNGVIYHHGGSINVDFNNNLRLHQRRTFLGPDFFNSGCLSYNCRDKNKCPGQELAEIAPETQQMFNHAFNSNDPFVRNDVSRECVGVKCNSYNSVSGWMTTDGKYNWHNQFSG